jgi:hypothetical protein
MDRLGASDSLSSVLVTSMLRAHRSVASGDVDGNSIGNPFMPLADGEAPYGTYGKATRLHLLKSTV